MANGKTSQLLLTLWTTNIFLGHFLGQVSRWSYFLEERLLFLAVGELGEGVRLREVR